MKKNIAIFFLTLAVFFMAVNSCNSRKAVAEMQAQATAQAEAETQAQVEAQAQATAQAEAETQAQVEAQAEAQEKILADARVQCYHTMTEAIARTPGELVSFGDCKDTVQGGTIFSFNHQIQRWELLSPEGDNKVLVMKETLDNNLDPVAVPTSPYVIVDLSEGWEWFVWEEEVKIEILQTVTPPQTTTSSCRWAEVPNDTYYDASCVAYRFLGGASPANPNYRVACEVKTVTERVCDP